MSLASLKPKSVIEIICLYKLSDPKTSNAKPRVNKPKIKFKLKLLFLYINTIQRRVHNIAKISANLSIDIDMFKEFKVLIIQAIKNIKKEANNLFL